MLWLNTWKFKYKRSLLISMCQCVKHTFSILFFSSSPQFKDDVMASLWSQVPYTITVQIHTIHAFESKANPYYFLFCVRFLIVQSTKWDSQQEKNDFFFSFFFAWFHCCFCHFSSSSHWVFFFGHRISMFVTHSHTYYIQVRLYLFTPVNIIPSNFIRKSTHICCA